MEKLIGILQSRSTADDCQNCLNQIDDYIAMQLAGEDYQEHFARVASHLDSCVQCAQAYARLYELAIADAANHLPQPGHVPPPNLDFLQSENERQVDALRLSERLRQAVQHTAETVTLYLSVDLLDMLRPMVTAVPQTRTPINSERYQEILLQLQPEYAPDLDLPFQMMAYRDAQQPERCLIEVIVTPRGRSWPDLDGYRVRLRFSDTIWEALTDAWGLVAFKGVDIASLPELQIEVTLDQATYG